MRAMSVGMLAVVMATGCGDHFEDPVRPGMYKPLVWLGGCSMMGAQVLPDVTLTSAEDMAEHALRWEGMCGADPSVAMDGTSGTAVCAGTQRNVTLFHATSGFQIEVDGCAQPLAIEYVEHARCVFPDGGFRCGGDGGP